MAAKKEWRVKPSKEMIRSTSSPRIYKSGQSYYADGKVISAYINGNALMAVVSGGMEYDVMIISKGDQFTANCTCQFNSYLYYEACEHTIAVLMHLTEHFEEMLSEAESRKSTIAHMITLVAPGKALKFLADLMVHDGDARQEFVKKFKLEHVRPMVDHKSEVDRMYYYAAESDGSVREALDFGRYFARARENRDGGGAAEATKMYRGLSEAISGHMGTVDDSSGYYTDCFIEALESMAESIVREDLPADKKREHILYLFKKFMDGTPAELAQHYRGALEAVCIADDDAACLRDMIKPRLRNAGSGKSDNTTDLVRMQAHILEGLGRTAELETLLEKFHSLDRGLCVMYLDMLKRADQDKARRAARDATGAFPGDVRIMGAALELYPKAGPDYVPALRDLFAATGDWRYFFKLGEVSTDWHAEVATTASNLLRKGAPGTAVDAYLKGGMAGDAMDLLESLGDVELFAAYRTKMAKGYPDRYIAAYGEHARRFAKSRTGRDHYERVRKHLASIKAIPGSGDRYEGLMRHIRLDNHNKRVLLKIMEDL